MDIHLNNPSQIHACTFYGDASNADGLNRSFTADKKNPAGGWQGKSAYIAPEESINLQSN